MHFCWRSLDDKSLSSLLELRKNVFPMHVYKYCKNYMLKVYGYDYGTICFDTRLWYFTQKKIFFSIQNIKDMCKKFDCILYIEGKSLK